MPWQLSPIITKYLPSKALRNFNSSHRHAQAILGEPRVQKLKLWDPIFTDYEWVDIAESYGTIPGLLFINTGVDKPHVYLYLADKPGGIPKRLRFRVITDFRHEEEIIFEKVKLSLRSASPGRHHCEVLFEDFTLNLSNIRYGWHLPVLCKNVAQKFSPKSLVTAIYGERPQDVKPRVVNQVLVEVVIPGFTRLLFCDAELSGIGEVYN